MKYFGLVICLLICLSCNRKVAEDLSITPDYKNEIEANRAKRIKSLTAPQGWLSVVGLHWLEEGINSIGAADDNNFIFPSISTETIGAYQKKGDDIFFGKVEGIDVRTKGQEYLGGPVSVGYPPEVINHESLYWYIIKRGDKYGIRLKDSLAKQRLDFDGIEYFDLDKSYRIKAKVREPAQKDSVSITNVLGQESRFPITAYLEFERQGVSYSMVALDEGGPNYFLIFSDATSGVETYGGGRFLYPSKPAEGETTTWLDFNKAVNPPCAFSDFATCPLPPLQNKLSFEIKAGEKYSGKH